MKKQYLVLATVLLLLAAFGIADFLYEIQKVDETSETAMTNASILVRDYSPTIGNENAKVTIVEFFDPACETCKAFHPLVKQIMESYPDKIKLVLRYAPFHDRSDYVAKILEAARLQNKFLETLEAAYLAQPVWAAHGDPQPEKLWMRLGNVGLDFSKAKEDMQSAEIEQRVRQDIADGRQLQVDKTPTFFVNGNPLPRFGYKELQNLVAAEIQTNY